MLSSLDLSVICILSEDWLATLQLIEVIDKCQEVATLL